jgi:hypothetical protein
MTPILKIAKKLDFESNIDVTADGDFELAIPILKTNCASINIKAKVNGDYFNIEVGGDEIGNNNDSLMNFYYDINNYAMREIGNLGFYSCSNLAISNIEIYSEYADFTVNVITSIIEKFNSYKDSIENEIEKNINKNQPRHPLAGRYQHL